MAERGGNEGATPPEADALPPPPAPEVPLPSEDPPALEEPDPEVGAVELPKPAREEERVVISKQMKINLKFS